MKIINLIIAFVMMLIGLLIIIKGIDKHEKLKSLKLYNKAEIVYLLYTLISTAFIVFGAGMLTEILIDF